MNSKEFRLDAIRRLLRQREIGTQEELQRELVGMGLKVTQATISRDLAELGLVRRRGSGGRMMYALQERDHLAWMLKELVREVTLVGNLVLVKASTGTAQGVAAAMDHMEWPEMVGSVAGDDTVLILSRTPEEAVDLRNLLLDLRGSLPEMRPRKNEKGNEY